MSRGSWRSAEALHHQQVKRRATERAGEKARLRRERVNEEWHITGEPAFRPKERNYPHGGGIDGAACAGFLGSAERAIHLYDRGKALTGEMSAALTSLERKHSALRTACQEFGDTNSSHLHPDRIKNGKWEVGIQELRLFVDAAERMTSAQRQAFTNVLAPRLDKSEGYVGPVAPMAASLQRAKNASIEQAVSGVLFSSGSGEDGEKTRRFARGVRVRAPAISKDASAPAPAATSNDGSSLPSDLAQTLHEGRDGRPSPRNI